MTHPCTSLRGVTAPTPTAAECQFTASIVGYMFLNNLRDEYEKQSRYANDEGDAGKNKQHAGSVRAADEEQGKCKKAAFANAYHGHPNEFGLV